MLDLLDELPGLLKTLRDQRGQLERIIRLDPWVLWNEEQRNGVEECRRQLDKVNKILRQLSKEGDN